MQKPAQAISKMAVEILYNDLDNLPHPDAGSIRLVNFGHKSDGQRKITRQVSEAIVMKLESNGLHIVNGLSEAVALLKRNGYTVLAPGEAPGEAPAVPSEALAATSAALAKVWAGARV